jgi:hypothetical protein
MQSELLEKAKNGGAIVRILTPISPDNARIADQLSEILEMKQLKEPFASNVVSVDSRELVAIDSRPDDLHTDRGSDAAIWTTNRLLVELYDQLFDRIWNILPTFQPSRAD